MNFQMPPMTSGTNDFLNKYRLGGNDNGDSYNGFIHNEASDISVITTWDVVQADRVVSDKYSRMLELLERSEEFRHAGIIPEIMEQLMKGWLANRMPYKPDPNDNSRVQPSREMATSREGLIIFDRFIVHFHIYEYIPAYPHVFAGSAKHPAYPPMISLAVAGDYAIDQMLANIDNRLLTPYIKAAAIKTNPPAGSNSPSSK